MLTPLLAQVADEGFNHAVQALTDAFSGGNVVLACVAGALIVGLAVLKFMGKKVPFVDTVVDIALGVAKQFAKKTPPQPGVEAVVAPAKDEQTKSATSNVVKIVKDE